MKNDNFSELKNVIGLSFLLIIGWFLIFTIIVGKDIFSYWKPILLGSSIILILPFVCISGFKNLLPDIFKFPLFISISLFINLFLIYNTEFSSKILLLNFLFVPIGWILFPFIWPKFKNNNLKNISQPFKRILLFIILTLSFLYSYIAIIIGVLFFAIFDTFYFINIIGGILK